MPTDHFAGLAKGFDSPADEFPTAVPNDSADLPFIPRGIACGATGGAVVCVDKSGNQSTFYMNAGDVLPIRPVRIRATGTAASPIILLK